MPYFLSRTDQGSLILFHGKLCMDDFGKVVARLCHEKDFLEHKASVWNFSEVDREGLDELTLEEIEKSTLCDWGSPDIPQNLKVAFVHHPGKQGEHSKSFVERAKRRGCKWDFKVYSTLEEAVSWTGLKF